MVRDADSSMFDVVVGEVIDRVGRRLADVARLYDHLEFRRIELYATNLGAVWSSQPQYGISVKLRQTRV